MPSNAAVGIVVFPFKSLSALRLDPKQPPDGRPGETKFLANRVSSVQHMFQFSSRLNSDTAIRPLDLFIVTNHVRSIRDRSQMTPTTSHRKVLHRLLAEANSKS